MKTPKYDFIYEVSTISGKYTVKTFIKLQESRSIKLEATPNETTSGVYIYHVTENGLKELQKTYPNHAYGDKQRLGSESLSSGPSKNPTQKPKTKAEKIAALEKALRENQPHQDVPVSVYNGWKADLAKLKPELNYPTNPKTIGSYTVADLPDGRVVVLGVKGNETPLFQPLGGHLQPNGRGLDGKRAKYFYFPKGKRAEVEQLLKNSNAAPTKETIGEILRDLKTWATFYPSLNMPKEEVLAYAKRVNALRNPGARTRDAQRTGLKVLAPTYTNLLRWIKNPGRYDLQGIDAPTAAKATTTARVGALDRFFENFNIRF